MDDATSPAKPRLQLALRRYLHTAQRYPRTLKLSAALLILLLMIVLASTLWLPGFAKTRLEAVLAAQLQRPVTVQSVDIHPFALQLTVRGVKVAGAVAGSPPVPALLSLDSLYIDLDAASLWRGAPVISAARLIRPDLHVSRDRAGRLSIDDLIEKFSHQPDSPKSYFSVNNILVEGGRIAFDDQCNQQPQVMSDIRIGVPFIANFDSSVEAWVEPHFSALINGAPIALEGKMRPFSQKREAALDLTLTDFDLTRISEYAAPALGKYLHLNAGRLDSRLKLTFDKEAGKAAMTLSGALTLRTVTLENRSKTAPWLARGDSMTVQIQDLDPMLQRPIKAQLKASQFKLGRRGDSAPALAFGQLTIDGIAADPVRRKAGISAILLEQPVVAARREENGQLDLATLFAPAPAGAAVAAPASAPTATAPWQVAVGGMRIIGGQLAYTDRTMPDAAVTLSSLEATSGAFELAGKAPLKFTLGTTINQRGKLAGSGSVSWAPLTLAMEVDAREIDLAALQGWGGNRINAILRRGAAGFRGQLTAGGMPLKLTARGSGRIDNVLLQDKAGTVDLLRWRSLELNDVALSTAPMQLDIANVALADYFARLMISPQGNLTLRDIVRHGDDDTQAAASATPLALLPADSTAAATSPAAVRIGQIALQNGNINFTDNFITPNYRANLTGLSGTVGPLAAGKLGKVDLRGAIDQSAPLAISGAIDPFGKELFVDLTARASGIDLPRFSPYSGKYVGYAIQKGKLSVDVHYFVEKGQLVADNNIVLDQLVFGDKVDSPSALSIPINLAVALMKNARGAIDLNIPISGSINDPQFSLSGILFKAFGNLLVKAVASPFALLGSLFGEGEELSQIDFAPGRASLTANSEKRLQSLAAALSARPALTLDITGVADPALERDDYRRAVLERRLKALRLAELTSASAPEKHLSDIVITPEEYPKYLELAYKKEKIDKPRNLIGLAKSLPVPQMEQVIMASIIAGEDEMRSLAERRARAARDWLIGHGVAVERVFVLAPSIAAPAVGKNLPGRAEFALR